MVNSDNLSICSECNQSNPVGNKYCIYCGSILEFSNSDPIKELEDIKVSMRELLNRISNLDRRISGQSERQNYPKADSLDTYFSDSDNLTHDSLTGIKKVIASANLFSRLKQYTSIEWETIIGKNWFSILGVTALSLGIAFFLLLAFDNGWISMLGRLFIGFSIGGLLLFAGDYYKNKYLFWARAVSGGGLGILYFTSYASFALYGLLSLPLGFILLTFISFWSGAFSIRYNSKTIGVLGILGAFLNPMLIISEMGFTSFIIYIAAVNLSVLFIAVFKNWRELILIAGIGSYVLIARSINIISDASIEIPFAKILQMELGLTVIFLIFLGATTFFHLYSRQRPDYSDLSLMLLNSLAFFAVSASLFITQGSYEDNVFYLTISIALVHLLLGYTAIRRGLVSSRVPFFFLSIAALFLVILFPVKFSGSILTVAWAAEGLLFAVTGYIFKDWRPRLISLILILVAASRLLTYDWTDPLVKFNIFRNDLFVTSAIVILVIYALNYIYNLYSDKDLEENIILNRYKLNSVNYVLVVIGSLLTVHLLTVQSLYYFNDSDRAMITAFFNPYSNNSGYLVLSLIYICYVSFLMAIGLYFKSKAAVHFSLFWGTLTLLKFILVDYGTFEIVAGSFKGFTNMHFLVGFTLILYFAGTSFNFHERRYLIVDNQAQIKKVTMFLLGLCIVFTLSTEIVHFFESQAYNLGLNMMSAMHLALTVLWALCALVLVGIGFVRIEPNIRLYGVALLSIPVMKLFLFDVFLLQSGYRVVAFISLGILLLFVGFGYQKYNQAVQGFLFGNK